MVVPSAGSLTGFKGSGTPATVPDCQATTGSGGGTGSGSGSGSGSDSAGGAGSVAGQTSGDGSVTSTASTSAPVLPAANTLPAKHRGPLSLRLLASRCTSYLARTDRVRCTIRLRVGAGGRLSLRLVSDGHTLATRFVRLNMHRYLSLAVTFHARRRPTRLRLLIWLRAPGARGTSVTRGLRVVR